MTRKMQLRLLRRALMLLYSVVKTHGVPGVRGCNCDTCRAIVLLQGVVEYNEAVLNEGN